MIGLRPDTAMAQEPPTIIVIDDDPSIRKALDNLFRSVGLAVELFGLVRMYETFWQMSVV